jgi:hypothetical protein
MMLGAVIFDPARFVLRFPQFAAYNTEHPDALQLYFDEAALILKNDASSLVKNEAERAILLNLLTAHIATLAGVVSPGGAGSTAGQVGRVSSASEGSVSASFDVGTVYASQGWYMSTTYGAQYWALTGKYRRARFVRSGRCC